MTCRFFVDRRIQLQQSWRSGIGGHNLNPRQSNLQLKNRAGQVYLQKYNLGCAVVSFLVRQKLRTRVCSIGRAFIPFHWGGVTNSQLSNCSDEIGQLQSRCLPIKSHLSILWSFVGLSQSIQLSKTVSLGPWNYFISIPKSLWQCSDLIESKLDLNWLRYHPDVLYVSVGEVTLAVIPCAVSTVCAQFPGWIRWCIRHVPYSILVHFWWFQANVCI